MQTKLHLSCESEGLMLYPVCTNPAWTPVLTLQRTHLDSTYLIATIFVRTAPLYGQGQTAKLVNYFF